MSVIGTAPVRSNAAWLSRPGTRVTIMFPGEKPSARFWSVGSIGLPTRFLGTEALFRFSWRPVGVAAGLVNAVVGPREQAHGRVQEVAPVGVLGGHRPQRRRIGSGSARPAAAGAAPTAAAVATTTTHDTQARIPPTAWMVNEPAPPVYGVPPKSRRALLVIAHNGGRAPVGARRLDRGRPAPLAQALPQTADARP